MTENRLEQSDAAGSETVFRVGALSFFNSRALVFGADDDERVALEFAPPAMLTDRLENGLLDAALAPSIDYQKTNQDWLALPMAAIGSAGSVLTVRVFARQRPEQIEHLVCDGDSHTSVVLAQIVWYLRYGKRLRVTPLQGDISSASAVLLIGDKVLGQLGRWPEELDLGAAWTDLTMLPFVYAFWMVPATLNAEVLAAILEKSYRAGRGHIDDVVDRYAQQHGFASEQGRRYLTENIRYEFGASERAGLQRFYDLARELGLIQHDRALKFYQAPQRVSADTARGSVKASSSDASAVSPPGRLGTG